MKNKQYPRIEIYTAQDYGNKNAGSNKTTDPSGKVAYMGRADYQPYVNKQVYLFEESKKEQLLALKLTFLPYFREQRPNITLNDYFDVTENKHSNNHLNMLPKDLEGYLKYQLENEREFFETIIEYQQKPIGAVTVIWLDETHWYVNNVFYSMDLDEFLKDRPVVVEEKIAQGTLENFIRFSNVIQPKLDEGYSYLRLKQAQPEFNSANDVVTLSLSPGIDGTAYYIVNVKGNGFLEVTGNKFRPTAHKVPHHKTVALLTHLNRLNFDPHLSDESIQLFNDGQTLTLKGWQNGETKMQQYGTSGTEVPLPVKDFFDFAFDLLADELGTEKP